MNGQIVNKNAGATREIKASASYQYINNGITLDGSKFTVGELVFEGQCLVMDNTSKKYEKAGADLTGKSNPVILDESIQLTANGLGQNFDETAGQVMIRGDVYDGMLLSNTAAFKTATAAFIRYVVA